MMERTRVTPMMHQYLEIKDRHRDAILFFRLGDFYEMFFEDAEKASKVLDIALTSRNRNDGAPVPLCGVPHHAATPYIGKLLSAGFKVAVCEQTEDPKQAKGVVRREVVKVISPGTLTEGEGLEADVNNFLAAVVGARDEYGLSYTDVTTGEFRFTQMKSYAALADELGRIQPRELLIPESLYAALGMLRDDHAGVHCTSGPDTWFSGAAVQRLHGAGVFQGPQDEWPLGVRAGAGILAYLEDRSPGAAKVLTSLEPYRASRFLMLDDSTQANLELLRSFDGSRRGSLLGVLEPTRTAMGARELRKWILYPLLDEHEIRRRHEAVAELVERPDVRRKLRDALHGVQDLERLSGRVASRSATPRDLAAVKDTLRALEGVRGELQPCGSELLAGLRSGLSTEPEVVALVERSVVDEPPATVRNGGFVRPGFDEELDALTAVRGSAKGWISDLQHKERERTGIHSLKVRYNKVFGYYIEVTKANLAHVPENYIRKQTLANGERFVTPELKDYEARVLGSDEEILKIEARIFGELLDRIAAHYRSMKESSLALARLDTLLALAETAESRHFVRPRVDSGLALELRAARHPVVEAVLGRGGFVPNDCEMDPETTQIKLLTGPNMAGKSTYMRQVALVVVLAQMGSFVPADAAHVGLVDRLFTRFGATDALAAGESTFMVEMKETARILRLATPRSLILLDEVGRGTSTFDGISIAWSLAEFLHESPHRPRTLFATHYHELTGLARTRERVRNFNFAVKEWQGEVIFLRTLKEGPASRSYGIQVAGLAGLPPALIDRAREILKNLEGEELNAWGQPRLAGAEPASEGVQLMLLEPRQDRLREKLQAVDVNVLTPLEALNLLEGLVAEAKQGG